MDNQKSRALTGTHNNRINKITRSDSQSTAAWAETGRVAPKSNVSIPDGRAVSDAKEWVDNGSRL